MAVFNLPSSPDADQVATVGNRKIIFKNGRWQAYAVNVPFDQSGIMTMAYPPVESEEAPALPSNNPFWIRTSTGQMYYQMVVDTETGQRAWVAIS